MGSSKSETSPLAKVEMTFKTRGGKGWEQWRVAKFYMKERLGCPYHGMVDIVADRADADFSKLLAKACVLELRRGPDRVRRFHGLVFKVEHLGTGGGGALGRVTVAATVHALSYGRNTRFFEDATAVEIIEKVLKEGLKPFDRTVRINVVRKYAKREYTTQFDEDDFSFIHRLLVEEGMTFHFVQGEEAEALVVVDSNYSLPRIKTMPEREAVEQPLPAPADVPNQVEVELVDEEGRPVPFEPFTFKRPDGTTREVRLDRDGWARMPIGKDASCEVAFANLDASAIEIEGG